MNQKKKMANGQYVPEDNQTNGAANPLPTPPPMPSTYEPSPTPPPIQKAETQTIPVDADTSEAQKQINNLDKQASEPQTKQVTVQITETYAPPKGGGGGGGAKYFVKDAYSSGTDNAPGGPSLVGEVEPEIVVDKKRGKWFVAERPQLVDLNKGDIVYNGKEYTNIKSST